MANIKYWKLECDAIRPRPLVNGILHIEGEFSWEEWCKLREMCFYMRSTGVKSKVIPRDAAISQAIEDIAARKGTKYKAPLALPDSQI